MTTSPCGKGEEKGGGGGVGGLCVLINGDKRRSEGEIGLLGPLGNTTLRF